MVESFIATARDPIASAKGCSRAIPLGRSRQAHEIAAAVLYLASDELSFTTGA